MATRLTQLAVSVLEVPVGELRHGSRHDATPYHFTYLPGLPDRASVALNMPAQARDYATPDLPPPFEQSLPEMNLAIFPAAIWKFVVRDRMGLLWASSKRRIGRVRFHSAELEARQQQPGPVALSRSDLASVKDGDELFRDAARALRDIPGVAGIQPKVLVNVESRRPGRARSRLTALSEGSRLRSLNTESHILKANHPDYVGATLVESLCLEAAELAGLDPPERVLSGDGRLLAIRRFDLTDDGGPLGFDEIGALLGRTAEHKYEGSLEEVAACVREFAGASRRMESLRRLFRLCILNNAVRNGDGHLKNFGLVYDEPADARLSPVYDVVSTTCFERLRNDVPALSLQGRKAWDDYEALLRFGRLDCGLSTAAMREVLEQTAAALEKVLPKIQRLRARFAYAAPTLWLMRAEWLASVESIGRALRKMGG